MFAHPSEIAEKNLAFKVGVPLVFNEIKIDSYQIRYVTTGEGSPILLIHGLNIGWGNWYANIAELSKHFKVYALDLPGCGQSTKIDFQKADLEKDFLCIVEKFILALDLKKVKMIGHSFGGWLALKIKLKSNLTIEKVILVNPIGFNHKIPLKQWPISFRHASQWLSKTAMKPNRKNMESFLKSATVDQSILKEEFIDYFHQAVIRERITHPFDLMNRLLKPFRFIEEISLLENIKKLKEEVLFIIGDQDPIIDFKSNIASLKENPYVKVRHFENIGHTPQLESADKFNETVLEFFLGNFK